MDTEEDIKRKEKQRAYYQANKERCKEAVRRYAEKNKEKRKVIRRRHYLANKEKESEAAYAWQAINPEKKRLSAVKGRAKRKGWDFDLDVSDLIVPEVCPILGIPLTPIGEGEANTESNASVDRIDSTKGYVKGNVWIISQKANVMKGTSSLKDFIELCRIASLFKIE